MPPVLSVDAKATPKTGIFIGGYSRSHKENLIRVAERYISPFVGARASGRAHGRLERPATIHLWADRGESRETKQSTTS